MPIKHPRRRRRTRKTRSRQYLPRTSSLPAGQERLAAGALAIGRGIAPTRRWNEYRSLEGEDRERVVEMLTRELSADLQAIKSIPAEEWTPPRLAVASGLSVSQVTRIFHDDPAQQRWRQFARDLKETADGIGKTATETATVLALAPGHQHCQSANGILRLAKAMGLEVGELLVILLRNLPEKTGDETRGDPTTTETQSS